VVVGAKGWNDSGIEERLQELADLPIHRTDFINDTDLAALYTGATAFVYPSFYEGFGIPCLEAMASGCPVICSNTSSLPEVVGDAALTVAPDDTDGLANLIAKLANDAKLRQKLASAGLKQAAQFTWQASARRLSAVIDRLQ
jgi:glycosyltransferase involved in cell wall biosynthesis